jgi:thiamine-phosphate pyrophosphorylase
VTVLEQFLEDAIDLEVDLIQIRERDLDGRLLAEVTTRAVALAFGRPMRIVVNDRADVALAADADGVHLPSYGPATRDVRSVAPSYWTIGRSVHSVGECEAERAADYLLYGTVFASVSKPDREAQGIDALKAAAASTRVPVIAIGGITATRARACVDSGAAGVAGIGIFLPEGREPGALGLTRAVAELRATLIM